MRTGRLAARIWGGHGARPAIALGVAAAWACGSRLSRWRAVARSSRPGRARLPLAGYGATRWWTCRPRPLLLLPALLVLGWAVGALRVRPADASAWAAGTMRSWACRCRPEPLALLAQWAMSTGSLPRRTSVCRSPPRSRLWRTLTLVFAAWRSGPPITARYLFWSRRRHGAPRARHAAGAARGGLRHDFVPRPSRGERAA